MKLSSGSTKESRILAINTFLLSFILAVVFAAAITSAAPVSVQLTISGGFPNTTPYGEMLYKYVEEYQRLNPHIVITLLPRIGDDQDELEKLYTAIAGGVAPDIVMAPQIFLTDYVARKIVAPVPHNLVSKVKVAYLPTSLFLSSYKNTLYGFPTESQSQAIVYNNDIFAQVGLPDAGPKTWTDLRNMAKRLTLRTPDNRVERIGFGGPIYDTLEACFYLSYSRSHGYDPLPLDMSYVNFSSQQSIDATNYFKQMLIEDQTAQQSTGAFGEGKVAMYMAGGPWHAHRWRQVGLGFYENLRSAPMPMGTTGNSETTFYGYLWAVTPYTKHPSEAFAFLFWLCTELTDRKTTRMGNVLEAQGNIPNTPYDARYQPSMKEPFLQGFLDVVITGAAKPIPPLPQWVLCWEELDKWATKAFKGEIPAQEAMANVDLFIRNVLDDFISRFGSI